MDNLLVEEYERNGLKVEIFYDKDPQSPRSWDNIGKMICAHRNYDLGDEQANFSDYHSWEHIKQELLIEERNAVIILPLNLFDHSGLSMSIDDSNGWDNGQVGFIYCTQEQVDKEFNGDKIKATQCLRSEVKDYDTYLRGEVYGFMVTDERSGDTVDSCWGFYGLDEARQDANANADIYKHPRESVFAKKASVMHG